MKKLLLIATVLCSASLPANAQESWTEVGGYLFATSIKGDAQVGNISADIDVPFSDVFENLDMTAMGYVEHRAGKWSFIGDAVYVKLSADDTIASNRIFSLSLDAEMKQLVAEGLVGYRVFEKNYTTSKLGIDLLGGARYNSLEIGLDTQAALLGLTTQNSRSPKENWIDGVVGLRAQYGQAKGWGSTALLDVGKGEDSSSYQAIGLINYTFDNNVKFFGGYRQYHMEYETGGAAGFEMDADYSGPVFGASYRF